jgi:hypothetical protein
MDGIFVRVRTHVHFWWLFLQHLGRWRLIVEGHWASGVQVADVEGAALEQAVGSPEATCHHTPHSDATSPVPPWNASAFVCSGRPNKVLQSR